MSAITNNEDDDNTAFTLPFTENSDIEVESPSAGIQEQEEVTTEKENDRNPDDDEPTLNVK